MIARFRVWHSATTQASMMLAAAAAIHRSNQVPHPATPLLTPSGEHSVDCAQAARESYDEQC